MHSKTFFAVFALAATVIAAPLPNDKPSQPSTGTGLCDGSDAITNLVGSPFCNGNSNGNGNGAGNNNDGNGSGNGSGDGNSNGNKNQFGNGNNIGSGNSGISFGRRNDAPSSGSTDPLGDTISNLVGSPFGNGNGNGNGNTAGSGNNGNGAGNGANDGNGNGDGNTFGNGNNIGSGNSGISFGRRTEKVRLARDIPPGTFDPLPEQEVDSLNKDVGQVFTDGPKDVTTILEGAVSGKPSKRQVFSGLEDEVVKVIGEVPELPELSPGF